jgi:hypothetical protein
MSTTSQHTVHLGRDQVAPHHTTTTTGTPTVAPTDRHRPWVPRLLGAAALASPLLMSLQYALDTAGLPREDAATYLGAVADDPTRYLASICVYIVSMMCLLAVARVIAMGCGRRAPKLGALAAVLLTVGALGGMGFAGLRLAALALTKDGAPVAGAVDIWVRIQEGPAFNALSVLLLGAIVGTLVATAAMWVARRDVTVWAAPLNVAGFVLASGEFPMAVSVLGGLVTVAATWPVVRSALRAA